MQAETSKLARRAFKDAYENPGVFIEGLFQFITAKFMPTAVASTK